MLRDIKWITVLPLLSSSAILSFPKGYNEETFVLLFLSEIIACHVSVNFLSSPGGNSCHHARHFNTFQQISKYLPCRLHKQPILLLDFWCVISVTKSMIILQTNTWLEGNHDNLVTHIYYLFKCFINFKVFSNRKSEKPRKMKLYDYNLMEYDKKKFHLHAIISFKLQLKMYSFSCHCNGNLILLSISCTINGYLLSNCWAIIRKCTQLLDEVLMTTNTTWYRQFN